MNAQLIRIICPAVLFVWACSIMASSLPSRDWSPYTMLNPGTEFLGPKLKLSHNSPDIIRQEILDTNTVRLIAKSNGLSDKDLATIQVVREPGSSWIHVNQIGKSEKAEAVSEQLRNYIRAREQGHTKEFILSALTNRADISKISDPGLRAIVSSQPLLPLSFLKKIKSGTSTNKAGEIQSQTTTITTINGKSVTNEIKHIPKEDEVCRWVTYALVDGEVGWVYQISFRANGSLDDISESRCDAKDIDPKFQKIIRGVEDEVNAEMKKDGSLGEFGSVHTFWGLKKEKLKAKGIAWRSPSELNPNTSYD